MTAIHNGLRQQKDTVSQRRAAFFILLGATALTAPLVATPALAQQSDDAAVDSNTIIVTAQRRSEAVEDVPMTVTVLSPDTLAAAGISSVRDLANLTTGFQVGNGGSYPQPSIRGVTTINAGSYENNVALFVDGLYQTTPQVLNMDLPNVQNIQVLKGPQGTLYGRNATGGAILIDTIDPGDAWQGNVEATYARFDDKRVRGYLAGPLSDSVGFSIAGTTRRTDGYYKRASLTTPGEFDGRFLGLKQDSVRAKLKFDLTDSFRATLGYNYTRASDPRGVLFTPIENVASDYVAPGRNTRPRGLGEAAGDAFDIDLKSHEGSLRLELDTGVGTLRSVTGYTLSKYSTTFDFNGSYVADSYSTSINRDRTWQESLDFSVNAISGLDLILGGTYYNIKTSFTTPNTALLAPAGSPPGTPLSSYRIFSETYFTRTKEAWAVFADATAHITDALSLNVGARYSKETQDVSGEKYVYNPVTGALTGTPYTYASSARTSRYKKFTPRASLRYELAQGTNIYASYSKGFRGGEWNSVIPNDNPNLWRDVGQETVDAYEVGFKTAGSRLRFELAGFLYDYKNLQTSFTQNVNGIALVILQSAPKAKIKGVEASVDYKLTDTFNLRAGATYLHARYGDGFFFTGVGVNPAVPGFNANSDPLKTFVNRTLAQDLSGLQMSRAPNFSAYGGFDFRIPNGDGGLTFSANAKYTDSYVVTNPSIWGGDPTYSLVDNDPTNDVINNGESLAGTPYADRSNKQRARQGKYVLLNASVTWSDPSDTYYVRAWGNNLTNQIYRIHYNPTSTGTYQPIAEPRTYGLTLGYKFRDDGAAAMPPPPPPPPPPAPAVVAPPPVAQAVCNKGPYIVFFDWDKSDITPEASGILDSAVTAYGNCDRVPIMLAGYTDRSGAAQYNQGLSERRNASVRTYLTGRGVPDTVITSQAFGETNNRVPTADGVRELQNRRVEISYGPGSGM